MSSSPDIRGRAEPSSRGVPPLFWLLLLLAGAGMVRAATQWNVPLPVCGFRRMTSLPCPLCGGTRTVRSIAELDFGTAFVMNPLVAAGFGLVVIWCVFWGLDKLNVTHVMPLIQRHLAKWPATALLFFLVLINWAYLIRTLP